MTVSARLLPAAVVCACLTAPAAASAHAELEGTSPSRGAALKRVPDRVVMRFSEPVEASFGAVRVFDRNGRRVDSGRFEHPRANTVAVGLRGGLGEGAYTATHRVVSADSHPVSGGFVFTVGKAGRRPAESVATLASRGGAGVTEAAFGAVRALGYAAIALAAGGLAFMVAVWLPALRSVAGGGSEWQRASDAFGARAGLVLRGALGLGLVTSALGILLQGAAAGGTSLWAALDPSTVRDVLGTRFGTVWAVRLGAWLLLALLLLVPATRARLAVLRPAALGATGLAARRLAGPAGTVAASAVLGLLILTPALAGHARSQADSLLLVPSDVLHVAAMSVWLGGLALLVAAVPAATGRLERADRTRLLAAAVARFSTVALCAVAVLLASGVLQSIVYLSSFGDLLHSPFGRAIAIKACLFVVLVGLGAYNRQRSRPELARLAHGGGPPGAAGLALRRALRAEVALLVVVLGVTGALVSYAPTSSRAVGPFAAERDLGPARLELTVDPARMGANEVHLYLFDRRTGAQFDRAKELRVTATLPSRRIGPLRLDARKTGPGHYTVTSAALAPAGDWTLTVLARTSAFDEHQAKIEVPVR